MQIPCVGNADRFLKNLIGISPTVTSSIADGKIGSVESKCMLFLDWEAGMFS